MVLVPSVQWPLQHKGLLPFVQTLPQLPQLFTSVKVSTHWLLLQQSWPVALHAVCVAPQKQAPFSQRVPLVHDGAHIWPTPGPQCPPLQTSVGLHAMLQPPQCWLSIAKVEAARAPGQQVSVGVALIHRAGAGHALTIRTAVGGAALHAALAAVVFVGL